MSDILLYGGVKHYRLSDLIRGLDVNLFYFLSALSSSLVLGWLRKETQGVVTAGCPPPSLSLVCLLQLCCPFSFLIMDFSVRYIMNFYFILLLSTWSHTSEVGEGDWKTFSLMSFIFHTANGHQEFK